MLSRHWENSLTSSCDSNICWVLGLSISFNSNAVHLLIEGESFWNPSNATNSSFYQKLSDDLLLFILWMVYQLWLIKIQRHIVIWNWQSRWIINGLWPNWLYKLNNLINYDSPSDVGSWPPEFRSVRSAFSTGTPVQLCSWCLGWHKPFYYFQTQNTNRNNKTRNRESTQTRLLWSLESW